VLRRVRGLSLSRFRAISDGELRFGPAGSGADLHVVTGGTGTGKTTCCHALALGLYGTVDWVSAANASLPAHDATDGPVTATVAAEVEATDGRCRVERTITESDPEARSDVTVGTPQVERHDGSDWRAVDDPTAVTARVAPPETESLLLTDPGLRRAAGPAGWAPVVQGLLGAAAAARSARDSGAVGPADLWPTFREHLDAYVETVGPAPHHEVTTGAEPFTVDVGDEGSGSLPTDATIQFGLALTLAAGDCAGLPGWFDAPFGRLDGDAIDRAIEGFVTAAERRQVVVLPHEASVAGHPALSDRAATEHHLELADTHRAAVRGTEDG
jgi:hypothetical protein